MKVQGTKFDRTPLISVIMPAYNSAKYIEQSIKSVQGQSYENWELLVIDDASSDETTVIIKDLAKEDCRIKLHVNDSNQGTAWCRNYAAQISQGEFVAYLDSDDIWYADKLGRQLSVLAKSDVDLVYCSYGYIDEAGVRSPKIFRVPEQVTLKQMLKQNVIGCSTVMVKKAVAAQYRFSSQYYLEDFVLWLSMLKDKKQLYGLTDALVDYRIRKNSRSNNKLLCAKHRWTVFREFLKFSRLKSMYYMVQYATAGIIKYINR